MSGPSNPYAPPQVPGGPTPPAGGGDQFAPCPSCGNVYAKRAGFTWWGGALGPRLFNHVHCLRCRQGYNGKTGKSNDTAIAIYLIVSLVLGVMLGAAAALAGLFG